MGLGRIAKDEILAVRFQTGVGPVHPAPPFWAIAMMKIVSGLCTSDWPREGTLGFTTAMVSLHGQTLK